MRPYTVFHVLPQHVNHARHNYQGVPIMRKYNVFNFLLDIILVCFTGGLWLIWIFCREMRRR